MFVKSSFTSENLLPTLAWNLVIASFIFAFLRGNLKIVSCELNQDNPNSEPTMNQSPTK